MKTTVKEYRTTEQFETIADNCLNGNWKDAAKNCVDFGFYANDLINHQEQSNLFDDLTDLAILAELATELRYK